MRVLTPEEAAQAEKELNDFIMALDFNTKANIRRMLENYYNIEKNKIRPEINKEN